MSFFEGEANNQDLTDGLGLLNSPASRELTLQHHTRAPLFPALVGITPYLADPLRTNFVSSLSALGGYPNQLRRVAVTDGALDATPQHDQNGQVIHAGDQAFLLEQRGVPRGGFAGTVVRILWPIGLLGRLVTTAKGRVYYGAGYGQLPQVLDAFTITAGSINQYALGAPNSCSLDAAAGGYRNFIGFAGDGPTGYFNNMFAKRNFYTVRDRSCFIPTLSALGYTQPADNCQPAGQNLVCAGTTPFDAYYGPTGHNDEHLHLTPENVAFMRNETLLKTPSPVFLSTPTALCPGGTATFSVKAECARAGQPATAYTWTVGNGLQVVGSQGTATAMVQATAGFNGIASVRATATRMGYVASTPASAEVYVGAGYVRVIGPTGPACFYSTLTYTTASVLTQGAADWHVYLNNVLHDEFITSNAGTSITVQPAAAGRLEVLATDLDACPPGQAVTGSATTTIVSQMINPIAGMPPVLCDQMRAPKPAAYPNPADGVLHLATPETADAAAAPRTAVLYNGQGREMRRTRKGEAQLATADLPAGLYYLLTEQNGHLTRSQIRVQH